MTIHRVSRSMIAVVVLSTMAYTQTRETASRSAIPGFEQSSVPQSPVEASPLDAPLDPTSYRMGGGDKVSLQVETVPPLYLTLMVGVDGMLVIPNVGSVTIGGMTLQAASKKLALRISERMMKAPVSISLAQARRVRIRVRGSAVTPNDYEVTASDRVSSVLRNTDIVRPLFQVSSREERPRVESVPLARRSILLIRSDGGREWVDLDMFRSTGDSRWNPHVAEGDEIIANVFDNSTPSIAIGGAVWAPGEYEYVTGDKIADLLRFARGLRSDAVPDSGLFARLGESPRTINVHGPDSTIALLPGDRVWVGSNAPSGRGRIVTISGEVRNPGTYPMVEGVTRLSDLVRMAGGLTGEARVHGATMHRARVEPEKQVESQLLALRGNAAIDDTMYVRQEEELRLRGERVSVDFREALSRPGSEEDPFVHPGDRINVPRATGTVYVFGQVVSPGHVRFVSGEGVSSYLRRAGGLTDKAKSGDIVVIKSASRQWIDPDDTVIDEGDAIWIPKEVDQPLSYDLASYSQVAGIISALATVVFIFTQIK